MHQRPEPRERRPDNSVPSECVLHTEAMESEPLEATEPSNMPADFHALFGFARELTDNLETQLGNFDSQGLSESMWTFNEETIFDGFP